MNPQDQLPEELQKQIENEADALATGPYYKDGSTLSVSPQIYLKRGYIAGATTYALRAYKAEREVERLRSELEKLMNIGWAVGVEGAKWGDTDYDSMSAVAGYNEALASIRNQVLKTLQGEAVKSNDNNEDGYIVATSKYILEVERFATWLSENCEINYEGEIWKTPENRLLTAKEASQMFFKALQGEKEEKP